jgi:hypothetical protein
MTLEILQVPKVASRKGKSLVGMIEGDEEVLCSMSGPPRSVDTLQVRELLMPC